MKSGYKGTLLDLDRRSRESVPPRRSRMSRDWIPLGGRLAASADLEDAEAPRWPWLSALPLALAAFRAGRLPLLRAAEQWRGRLFQEPVRLTRFVAIGYRTMPASVPDELAWLRHLGVRQVVLPIEPEASDAQQARTLAAIQHLRQEDLRVAAVLGLRRGAGAAPEAWHQFCHWILSQVGWQLDCAQLGDGIEAFVRERRGSHGAAALCAHVPRLRHDYPGVALLAPGVEQVETPALVTALRKLLPAGAAWDGMTLLAPAWQALGSVARDHLFLRQLTLAGGLAVRPGVAGGRVQVVFPPPQAGCDAAAAERIAGSVVRRSVLALCSGVADRVTIGMDAATAVPERQTLSTAIRTLVDQLEGGRLVRRVRVGDPKRDFVLEFAHTDKPSLLVGWTDGDPQQVSVPFLVGTASDFLGRSVPMLPHPRIRLTRSMAYFKAS